jgi:hypothetical protein
MPPHALRTTSGLVSRPQARTKSEVSPQGPPWHFHPHQVRLGVPRCALAVPRRALEIQNAPFEELWVPEPALAGRGGPASIKAHLETQGAPETQGALNPPTLLIIAFLCGTTTAGPRTKFVASYCRQGSLYCISNVGLISGT